MRPAGRSRHTSRPRSSMAQGASARASLIPSAARARPSDVQKTAAGPRAPLSWPLLAKVKAHKGRTAGVDIVTRGFILLVQGILHGQASRPQGRELPAGAEVDETITCNALLTEAINPIALRQP